MRKGITLIARCVTMSKKTRPYIVVRIKFGGPLMPAFGKTLTDGEINSLVDYLAAIKPQTP